MHETAQRSWNSVIPPATLLVCWPGDDPPLAEEVRLRLAHRAADCVREDVLPPEGTLWAFRLSRPACEKSWFVWCEPVAGLHNAVLSTVHWWSAKEQMEVGACRWVVGVEAPLSPTRTTLEYQDHLRLCEAISRGQAPAIYDANSFLFRTPHETQRLTATRAAPTNACLYSMHRVKQRSASGESLLWLHTHGLERAGIPDLELIDVPESLAASACELIESVADLWIEATTPAPESRFEIGHDLWISWRPWQAVAAERDAAAAGGWRHRKEEFGHVGYRAVLVAATPNDHGKRRWASPVDTLRSIGRSEVTLFKSVIETDRRARLARERFGEFGILFAGRRPRTWRFAVKLRYPMANNPRFGEHLWFEVRDLKPGRILATLISQPAFLTDLRAGDTAWHELERLSDWRIVAQNRTYDPTNAEALLNAASEHVATSV